jgi:nucleoside-diphosphate-sugar epimerase
MKVLVLGSHGCVGTAICKIFTKYGHEVIPWDIKLGKSYDLRQENNLDTILPEVDFVIFLAFDVGGSKYKMNSIQYIENNVDLMKYTFRSLEKYKKPFIHTSSQMSNMNNNPYAVLKRLGELYTESIGGISVKLWNVYGSEPISEKSHVIPDFLHQAIFDGTIQMRTDGSEERQFLYCDDFAEGVYTIYQNYDALKNKGEIDITTKQWISIRQVANVIQELTKETLGNDITISEGTYKDTFQNRKNEPSDSYLNSIWSPQISIKEGMRQMFHSMLKLKEGN